MSRPETTSTAEPSTRASRNRRVPLVATDRFRPRTAVLEASVGVFGLLVFYRLVLRSGGDVVPSEIIDGRFCIVVLEHWVRVLAGREGWRSPNFYHPVSGVLGYSEMLVLFAPPYLAARLLRLDPFSAFQVTMVTLSALGFAGTLWLLRSVLRLHPLAATAGAYIFAFHFTFAAGSGHPHMLTAEVVPFVLGFLLRWFESTSASDRRRNAIAVGLLVPLVASTSFYIGYFTVLALAIGIVALVLGTVVVSPSRLMTLVRERALSVGLGGAVAAMAAVPLVLTYVPVLPAQPYVTWDETLRNLPSPVTERVGTVNLVLFAVGVLVAFIGRGTAFAVAGRAARRRRAVAMRVMAITVIVGWALMFRAGDRTLWHFIFEYVPGAAVLRVPDRFNHVLKLGVVAVGSVAVSAVAFRLRRQVGWRRHVGFALLGAVLVCSGYEQVWPTYAFSKSAQLALLHAVPDPPPECASFYALSEEPDGRVVQVDAMIVAQAKDIPTLNGYSGRSPDGWLLNWPPDRAPYRREVEAWTREHGLTRVCALDFATKTWSVVDPP